MLHGTAVCRTPKMILNIGFRINWKCSWLERKFGCLKLIKNKRHLTLVLKLFALFCSRYLLWLHYLWSLPLCSPMTSVIAHGATPGPPHWHNYPPDMWIYYGSRVATHVKTLNHLDCNKAQFYTPWLLKPGCALLQFINLIDVSTQPKLYRWTLNELFMFMIIGSAFIPC